jgi:hypothetical protein
MSEITIQIPKDQPELAASVLLFINEEFNQQVEFTNEYNTTGHNKDAGLVDLAWQGVIFLATIEGSLQFSERVRRMERVKKLLATIKNKGHAVYLKINKKDAVDISRKSVDETMDLLADNDEK